MNILRIHGSRAKPERLLLDRTHGGGVFSKAGMLAVRSLLRRGCFDRPASEGTVGATIPPHEGIWLRVSRWVLLSCSQDFVGGGAVFLGGIEALDLLEQGNPANIEVVVDCRGRPNDRSGNTREVPSGLGLDIVHLPATNLTKQENRWELRRGFEPIYQHLKNGKDVLMHCVNGKHRSRSPA